MREPYARQGDEMDLPKGKVCGDCIHINRCRGIYARIDGDEVCDWYPSRFNHKEG